MDQTSVVNNLQNVAAAANVGSMLEPWNIFFSILFGLIGVCLLAIGKKVGSFIYILFGVGLMSYTFVVTSTAQVIWVGLALTIIPFLLDKYL